MTTTPEVDEADGPASMGAVFTKPWVVNLVLDLAGYREDRDLTAGVLVEPSVGHGAFLAEAARRLVRSARLRGVSLSTLDSAIVGVDLDQSAVAVCRANVASALEAENVEVALAHELANAWIRHGDFLLATDLPPATWVVGNPPYVRVEDVPKKQMEEYRKRWTTMSGRADVYVGFIEASLRLLVPDGKVAFICADRWMRNQYGSALRKMIVEKFAMEACIVMHDAKAFDSKVAAYPAITVLGRRSQGKVLVSCPPASFREQDALDIVKISDTRRVSSAVARKLNLAWSAGWFKGSDGWPDADPGRIAVIADLEARHPRLEDAGVRIGVGAATGLDSVFATKDVAGIESARLIKVVSARETATGSVLWAGRYLVNPWDEDGLADLDDWPGMRTHFANHADSIKARHVAIRNPEKWWRTLDRVRPSLANEPKLLVPDLKDRIFPVLDEGTYYPSHSLYFLTSDTWDLEVLGGLLLSETATWFIEAYSVRMANGYLRVSAQYLRRVRIPDPTTLTEEQEDGLRSAFRQRNLADASRWAALAYGV